MPEQRTGKPAAERDRMREEQPPKQRRGVVDLPSGHDHQDHRDCIDPVRRPHPGRLKHDLGRGSGRRLISGGKAGHGVPVVEGSIPLLYA